ncbi:hypothetical protein RN001_015889 [Aquatica leii]|uniref:Uncharacterized protein n=1 Tax=Aquatica leii TaxID=1421715 RepID=A0AAN7NTT2_9COLE|nr:hypothetical protein RN001_015889 [Aquatica leii]
MINYSITNRQFTPSEIIEVRTLNSANIGSDHSLVLCKIRRKSLLKRKAEPIYSEKLNVELLEDESTRNLYKVRLKNNINKTPITENNNPDEAWTKIKNNILKAAKEAVGTRKVKKALSNNKIFWYIDEVKKITERKNKAFLRYKTTKT